MRYRKKPVEISAWRWDGNLKSMPSWVAGAAQDRVGSESLFIKTLEGVMEARLGDYIIQGVAGEVYPCKPDIFKQTYDAVETLVQS